MNIDMLPSSRQEALEFLHFPTRLQVFIWRNWDMVPVSRLADVLKTTEEKVVALAVEMGLPPSPAVSPLWLSRGYITIIRNNWHLIPYDQLLQLLQWGAEKMDHTLCEDDFLASKLGPKPVAASLVYRVLTNEEIKRTAELKSIVSKHTGQFSQTEAPFGFLKTMEMVSKEDSSVAVNQDFDFRLAYSYSAIYGDPLIDPDLNPYPDGMLAAFASRGINAIWLQGILHRLVHWDIEPELSKGKEIRQENLRLLCQRAKQYGIDVYLYLNEPRGLTMDFYEKHPELKGVNHPHNENLASMCTSRPEVISFLREGTAELFQEVPELGGVFTITMSENISSCHSKGDVNECPLCSKRSTADVVAEVNRTIAEGVHSAKPDARVIAWTWSWQDEWAEDAIAKLPKGVELMCTSERELETCCSDVTGLVSDYSISQVGPGPFAKKWWKRAKECGLKVNAKVQLNNTWECSAVPYLPVPQLIEEHLANIKELGVSGLMVSWTLGGFPGGNLELLNKGSAQLAEDKFGKEAAPQIKKAWSAFSESFKEFPLNRCSMLYRGPQNYGPVNLFYPEPTGFISTMLGFPYDDVTSWCGALYSKAIIEEQFRKLCSGWQKGLDILYSVESQISDNKADEFIDLKNVATATYCHFQSTYNLIRFLRLRDDKNRKTEDILSVIDDELSVTKTLLEIMLKDSRIGFEASNHYYYTANNLKEKIVNCDFLHNHYAGSADH